MSEFEDQEYNQADQNDHAYRDSGEEYEGQEEGYSDDQGEGEGHEEEQGSDDQAKDQEQNQESDRPWPKKASRALSRQKRKTAQLQQQLQQMRQEIDSFKKGSQKGEELKEPNPDDYDNYSEYLRADSRYQAKKAYEEERKAEHEKTQQELQQEEQQMAIMGRAQQAQKMTKELSKQIPDIYDVLQDNEELDSLPSQYQQMILSTKNPSLTAYNLAKSENLADLSTTHPQLAAQMIFHASTKKPGGGPPRGKGKIPRPMRGLGGQNGGTGGISADEDWESMKKKMGW